MIFFFQTIDVKVIFKNSYLFQIKKEKEINQKNRMVTTPDELVLHRVLIEILGNETFQH